MKAVCKLCYCYGCSNRHMGVTLHHCLGGASSTSDLICVWELGLVVGLILLSDAEAQEGKVSYTLY